MYTIEVAYARMRELQDLANRSRAHQSPAAVRAAEPKPSRFGRKKR
ncbi:hypothetical protein FHS39_003505 [Streptomyces olivoverticillatus]|uniref:Uncharacterized protein n=1 Tax=Streptomyces olivoverticillatus TaxID=66427 RepID=A0A7W7LQI3_9ACTN|nr:hypothetical protein [Streptomyces olivoverticillatus]MBB4894447.1 hypothetical protein [Streptomyces olivoverticillatus]